MRMYYFAFILVVAGNVVYHLSQKSIPKSANPFYTYIIIYAIALLGAIICSLFYSDEKSLAQSYGNVNWAVVTTGLSILAIEVGFLLGYRTGWNISSASVVCSVAIALILFPIGVFGFGDKFSMSKLLGIIFCIAGLILLIKESLANNENTIGF